jgi:hypothetical protein
MSTPTQVVTGKTGTITFPGAVNLRVYGITLSTGAELLDDSAYGGNGYRTRTKGLKDLSGSGVAFLTKDAGSNPFTLADATGSMTILWDTGVSVTFTAVFGNISIAGEYAGLNVVSFSFANAADTAPTVVFPAGS